MDEGGSDRMKGSGSTQGIQERLNKKITGRDHFLKNFIGITA